MGCSRLRQPQSWQIEQASPPGHSPALMMVPGSVPDAPIHLRAVFRLRKLAWASPEVKALLRLVWQEQPGAGDSLMHQLMARARETSSCCRQPEHPRELAWHVGLHSFPCSLYQATCRELLILGSQREPSGLKFRLKYNFCFLKTCLQLAKMFSVCSIVFPTCPL